MVVQYFSVFMLSQVCCCGLFLKHDERNSKFYRIGRVLLNIGEEYGINTCEKAKDRKKLVAVKQLVYRGM